MLGLHTADLVRTPYVLRIVTVQYVRRMYVHTYFASVDAGPFLKLLTVGADIVRSG